MRRTAAAAAARRFRSTFAQPPRVLAMGNTIMDTMLCMPRLPVDSKVWIDSKTTYVGGQGANAAQGMALMGMNVSFMTRLGKDKDGEHAREHYKALGIDTAHCIMVPDAFTMSATVAVETETQQRSCLMFRDSKMFDYCTKAAISGAIDALPEFDLVYTDGHQLDLVLPVVRKAVELGKPVMADLEVVDDEGRELASLVHELIAPQATIMQLAAMTDAEEAVTMLAAKRPGTTVIATCGHEGSVGARSGGAEAASFQLHHGGGAEAGAGHGCRPRVQVAVRPACEPNMRLNVRDTTGCGDAYHAGYVVAHARGIDDLDEAMAFATRVAAAKSETPGPVVSRESLEKFGIL